MRDRHALIFVVLATCGTLCILGSLGVLAHLYDGHAAAIASENSHQVPTYFVSFLVFVLGPILITIILGIWLLVKGIRIGQETAAARLDDTHLVDSSVPAHLDQPV